MMNITESATTRSYVPYTSEMSANRYLNKSGDETWVAWAEAMVVAGFSSPSLFVLLGEIKPFNAFEMSALFDDIVEELGIPVVSSDTEAVETLAAAIAEQYVRGRTGLNVTQSLLVQFPWGLANIYRDEDLHLDLLDYIGEWELSPEEEDAEADRLIREFHQMHPMTKWRPFEWERPCG
ncbi:hypothetical protein [Parasedimentitalea huanghaiensis]|uniref:Uncharacterized protein n=1 Tax=Parasedimentitalea huanghaiensis TaxID=2682100 RepID=A0A6L6WA36_9RHOB|nr:hypothetical protein [Zongyanglinia huanghaiensis]MVO14676.1 hypothetical protein [Zongyanglinia huanghaiensis]